MSFNRIQKLLFSEYRDFEDMVLVESPFAQTTRDGKGVRQVHLGLTPTKLILAVDILPSADDISSMFCDPHIDPLIETLELIAIYPVDCVNLSVFRRRKRQSLKARFCNNNITYYELGGFEKRTMFWNLWCERVRFLSPNDSKSILSETSVATSTSASTLKLLESSCRVSENGRRQMWLKYDCDKEHQKHFSDKKRNYINGDILGQGDFVHESEIVKEYSSKQKFSTDLMLLDNDGYNNFTSQESQMNQIPRKFLRNDPHSVYYTKDNKCSSDSTLGSKMELETVSSNLDFKKLSEMAVRNWEATKSTILSNNVGYRGRHPRRYAFLPQPHFLHGLGPWNISPGERFSVQKRSVSAVRIRRPTLDQKICLPVSKRLLTGSLSKQEIPGFKLTKGINKLFALQKPIIFFWTPEYWYRPQTIQQLYLEYLDHKYKIRAYLDCKKKNRTKKKSEKKSKKQRKSEAKAFEKIFDNIQLFSKANSQVDMNVEKESNIDLHLTATQQMRRILKMSVITRAWDFDSSCLAYQLTMIDTELFLKIENYELEVIVWQNCSKNAPNIGAVIAFSHRISCLVETEILREDSLQMRARLIVRFINIAQKCKELNNFQSCKSILNGLQSIPIYRLHNTWAHLRKYHSLKYLLFESLCRECNDPRLKSYQNIFYFASRKPPFLPSIADIFAKLLNKISNVPVKHYYEDKYSMTDENEDENNEENLIEENENLSEKRLFQKKNNKRKSSSNNRILTFLTSMKVWRSANISKEEKKISTIFENQESKPNRKEKKRKIFLQLNGWDRTNRKKDIEETIEFLNMCREAAKKYALTTNDLAKEYLLKARYREDKENFIISFRIEHPIAFL